jgi:metal-sulfur cluster biosynthetic enzyme
MIKNHSLMNKTEVKNNIIEAIKTIYDPEIPVNIYELGLIYEVNVGDEGRFTYS